ARRADRRDRRHAAGCRDCAHGAGSLDRRRARAGAHGGRGAAARVESRNRRVIELVYETHSLTTDNEAGIATGWLPGRLSETRKAAARALRERRGGDSRERSL